MGKSLKSHDWLSPHEGLSVNAWSTSGEGACELDGRRLDEAGGKMELDLAAGINPSRFFIFPTGVFK